VIPAQTNTNPDTKVVPYAMATARIMARHRMGDFLAVMRLRVRVLRDSRYPTDGGKEWREELPGHSFARVPRNCQNPNCPCRIARLMAHHTT
jgi:hypothetical protein